jgi:hypothetical protein
MDQLKGSCRTQPALREQQSGLHDRIEEARCAKISALSTWKASPCGLLALFGRDGRGLLLVEITKRSSKRHAHVRQRLLRRVSAGFQNLFRRPRGHWRRNSTSA